MQYCWLYIHSIAQVSCCGVTTLRLVHLVPYRMSFVKDVGYTIALAMLLLYLTCLLRQYVVAVMDLHVRHDEFVSLPVVGSTVPPSSGLRADRCTRCCNNRYKHVLLSVCADAEAGSKLTALWRECY